MNLNFFKFDLEITRTKKKNFSIEIYLFYSRKLQVFPYKLKVKIKNIYHRI